MRNCNIDPDVVKDFGSEWKRFDQKDLSAEDRSAMFESYFDIFPWDSLSSSSVGVDVGCGSGRWASLVAPRVGHLHLVDPSFDALDVARSSLSDVNNISFHQVSVDNFPFKEKSLDFAYSLGVLHHVPDTQKAICSIARILKPGAPFLLYLYYAFDQRPLWFRILWKASDIFRRLISRLPTFIKNFVCECIALLIYFPLARIALMLDKLGMLPAAWPLSYYRYRKYYVMRTDALDRFGTRLEKRFTRQQIEDMLLSAGFQNIHFSGHQPFWCAVGIKKGS